VDPILNTGKTYGTSPKQELILKKVILLTLEEAVLILLWMVFCLKINNNTGLSLHLGTRDANVVNCVFKNNGIFVAPDEDGLSCNNIYNNNFYDSTIRLVEEVNIFNRIYLSLLILFNSP
jgi:hypothetical protein